MFSQTSMVYQPQLKFRSCWKQFLFMMPLCSFVPMMMMWCDQQTNETRNQFEWNFRRSLFDVYMNSLLFLMYIRLVLITLVDRSLFQRTDTMMIFVIFHALRISKSILVSKIQYSCILIVGRLCFFSLFSFVSNDGFVLLFSVSVVFVVVFGMSLFSFHRMHLSFVSIVYSYSSLFFIVHDSLLNAALNESPFTFDSMLIIKSLFINFLTSQPLCVLSLWVLNTWLLLTICIMLWFIIFGCHKRIEDRKIAHKRERKQQRSRLWRMKKKSSNHSMDIMLNSFIHQISIFC